MTGLQRGKSRSVERVWDCQVGFAGDLPGGSDFPMREAVARAFRELTGREPDFIFSGWGGSLSESRRAVIDGGDGTVADA